MKIRMIMALLLCLCGMRSIAQTTLTGPTTVCDGSSITLSGSPSGGTWSSTKTGAPGDITVGTNTVTATATITGATPGATATVTYTAGGSSATVTVTVVTAPANITGTMNVCVGAVRTASCTPTGGMWTSSTPSLATINASTGVVSGISDGTLNITYTLGNGCATSKGFTVNPLPNPITGALTVCPGGATTLTTGQTGASWTSSNTSIATIASNGVSIGQSAGTATITFTGIYSCYTTAEITVNPKPTISGTLKVCKTQSQQLTGTPGGGTWNSSNTGVATVNSSTGLVTGAATAPANSSARITYTLSTAGCVNTVNVTVNTASVASIAGTATVCAGSTTALTCSTTAGTWLSGNVGVASVGSSGSATTGVVNGIAAGTSDISYELTASGCRSTRTVTVNAVAAPISGPTVVAYGSTITLTNAISGGTWDCLNTTVATAGSATGVVTGISPGTAIITYSLGGSTGCTGATMIVTVIPTITGSTTACVGTTITLTGGPTGGSWTPDNIDIATVDAAGIVTGVATGTTTISYTVSGYTATMDITVNPSPAAITGTALICNGGTSTFSDATAGGSWISSNIDVATVGSSSGVVMGTVIATAGTIFPQYATISYTLPTGCYATKQVTINFSGYPLRTEPIFTPALHDMCVGSYVLIHSGLGGSGTFASSNSSFGSMSGATITGVSPGSVTITFTSTSTGCTSTYDMEVHAVTPPIEFTTDQVCKYSTITLTNPQSGGEWYSINSITHNLDNSIAAAGRTTGIITGNSPGTATIAYRVYKFDQCDVYQNVTVNPVPVISGGGVYVAVGSTTTLSADIPYGTWSISGSAATVNSSGVVTGVTASTDAIITYTTPTTECWSTTIVHIVPARPGGNTAGTALNTAYTIAPNPGDGNFTISGVRNEKPVAVKVVNYVGATVYNGQLNMTTGEASLNLDKLSPGLYIIELKDGDGYAGTQKIVIEK